ncbi:MAG: transposase, partial [Mycobacterium sp.]|nr:transposase [Mycobacterium sp.]
AEHEGTQGLSTGDAAELKRLRAENAKLRMERDVLKRSVVLWVLSRVRDKTHNAEHRIMPRTPPNRLRGKGSVSTHLA